MFLLDFLMSVFY